MIPSHDLFIYGPFASELALPRDARPIPFGWAFGAALAATLVTLASVVFA